MSSARPLPTRIWLGDHELPGDSGYVVSMRGIVGLDGRDLVGEAAEGLLDAAAREQLTYTLKGEEGDVVVRGPGPELARAVEALVLRIQPREVALARLDGSDRSPWTTYPPCGALFVRMIHREESPYQVIEVGEHAIYGRMLFLNGETQIATSDEPLYSATLVEGSLGPDARRVAILGGGDCGVLREVLTRDTIEQVVMVEIDRAVVEVAARFFPGVVAGAREDPRARIVYADAFEHLRSVEGSFDLIVYDLSDTPLELESFDGLCDLVNAALKPAGRVAVQCGSGLPMYADRLAGYLSGLERNFRRVTTRRVVIPSFLEQPWVFASASRG